MWPDRSADVAAWQTPLLDALRAPAQGLATSGRAHAAALVVGDQRRDAAGRLAEYSRMFQARLVEALGAHYPKLRQALGDDAFDEMASAYLMDHPSRAPSLRDFGGAVAPWLVEYFERHHPGDARVPWLVDLARLEWTRTRVFDASDEPIMELSTLATLSAAQLGGLVLKPVVAHRLLPVAYSVEDLWDASAVPGERPGLLLVWREGVTVFHRRASELEARGLEALREHPSFERLCETLAPHASSLADIARIVQRWVQDELIVELIVGAPCEPEVC